MKTVMIVDDESNILSEVKAILEQDDFEVVTAQNSRNALELMENEASKDFGLILIDSLMPDTKEPALFSMKPSSGKKVDTTKTDNFLMKPFTRDQLVDFVKNKIRQD